MTKKVSPDGVWDCQQFHAGSIPIGGTSPLVLIAGPCVIESHEHTLTLSGQIAEIAERVGIPLIFKASYDKANRSSVDSYRGPGLGKGLEILAEVKATHGLPLLTDVHTPEESAAAAEICDVLQIPAFLCRQTDFVEVVGKQGKPVNVKKGQFLAPEDIVNVVNKLRRVGCEDILLTERGVSFGYNNLVSDFRSLSIMRQVSGLPVCFDATHSVQQPGGLGNASGGRREFVPVLARAACGAGVNALFLEVHDQPDKALSDGPNMVKLEILEQVLRSCLLIDKALRDAIGVEKGAE